MRALAVCLSSQCQQQQPPQKFIVGFLGRACCFIVVFFAGLFKSNCSTFNIGTHSMLHMAWFSVSVCVFFPPRVFCVYFHNVYPNRAWDTPQKARKQQRLPLIATDSNFDIDTNSRLPQSQIRNRYQHKDRWQCRHQRRRVGFFWGPRNYAAFKHLRFVLNKSNRIPPKSISRIAAAAATHNHKGAAMSLSPSNISIYTDAEYWLDIKICK